MSVATIITQPGTVITLEEIQAWLLGVGDDLALSLTDRDFRVEVDARKYTVVMPFEYDNPKRVWTLTVDDLDKTPDRTPGAPLGYEWEWKNAFKVVSSDVTTFFQ